MKQLCILLWALCATSTAWGQADDEFLTDRQGLRLLQDYLREYSPDSYFLMQDFESLPTRFEFGNSVMALSKSEDPLFWIGKLTPQGIREDIGTAVHETNHGYTDLKAYQLVAEQLGDAYEFGANYSAFYINRNSQLLVPHREVVNSHAIARAIPRELRTFRFRPYISPISPILGSQKDGIYGLMDEWCSYMNGTRTQVDLYEYYAAHPAANGSHWLEWIQNVAGTHFAYLEFKYFILRYLIHVRDEEEGLYEAYLTQPELLEAFFAIDDGFSSVVTEFYEKKASLAESLQDQGLRIDDDGEFFIINGNGVGTYEDEFRLLESELQKPEYQSVLTHLRQAYQRSSQ